MNVKNFVLSYYNNATENFHIQKVEKISEAKKPHTHDYFQIYFIIKGSLFHHVEQETACLSQGDMFIVPPGATHYISPNADTVFYSFSFMEEFLCESHDTGMLVRSFLRSLQNSEGAYIKPKISMNSEEILHIESIMAHIEKEFRQKPMAYDENIRSYARLLVTLLARGYFAKTSHNITDHFESNKQLVLHCVKYVEDNFKDPISLDDIAKKSAISKSNFCSLFKELTGYSFQHYVNLCRIRSATEYIKKGYKITAIYGLCGYNDFSTFNRNFHKIMGTSPRDYKMLHAAARQK